MSFFSRKSLVAAATAATLTFSGVGFAHAEDQPQDNGSSSSADSTFFKDFFAGSSNEDGELDPREFTAWINAFTNIIRTMDQVLNLR